VNDADAPLLIELRGMQRNPILRRSAGEIVLGEIGTVVRGVWIWVIEREAALISLTTQSLGGAVARGTRADDDHRIRSAAASRGHPFGLPDLADDIDLVATLLYPPAGQIVECGRAESLARPEAEAGMVPRAVHSVTDQNPLWKGTTIVAADRSYREPFAAGPGQEDWLPGGVPGQHATFGDLYSRNTGREIGAGDSWFVAHRSGRVALRP
jgi:hypothetical protein